MSNPDSEFDLIVVGGGPAGSTAATFVAMKGHRVLLLEKEQLPCYKVGESLLPATIHGIAPLLGVSDALKEANFVLKRGGTFRWGKSKDPWTFSFASSSSMAGPTSTAYQVERMKFDKILLDNARDKGVDVRERHKVTDLLMDGDRVAGLHYVDDQGVTQTARSRYVVDATGHQTPLARSVGERVYSKFFQNVALFGYFKNAGRLPEPNRGNIFCAAFKYGWFWFIPLSDELTSVGAVIGAEHAGMLTGGYEAALKTLIGECTQISDLLANAERIVEGPYGELRVRKDYSYTHTHFWRPGLALAGDAACFVDPVFSSGVHLATYSGLLVARSVNACLAGVDEKRSFDEFEVRYRREYSLFYDFLLAFYDVNQDAESYFWHARKVTNSADADNVAFLNLVGGVASSGEPLFPEPEKYLKERVGLGEVLFREAAERDVMSKQEDMRRRQFFSKFTGEATKLQMLTLPNELRPREKAVIEKGLVASADGLLWVEASSFDGVPKQAQP